MDFAEHILHLHLRELELQGHKNTGKLARDSRVYRYGDIEDTIAAVRIEMPDYAAALDTGVRKGKVPFGSRRGKGGGSSSNYIEELIEWLQDRYPSQDAKERRKSAFKIGRAAAKTGHPTPGSYKYSQNGRRTGFTKAAIAEIDMGFVEDEVVKFWKKKTSPKYEIKLLLNFD